MNYHQPRQVSPSADRPDAGKWRYTYMNENDGAVWPEGYCAECPGHDTKEGAYEHQTQYVLDNARYDGKDIRAKRQCRAEGCDEWTQYFAEVDDAIFTLCDAHRNRETLALLYGSVGDSFGSW